MSVAKTGFKPSEFQLLVLNGEHCEIRWSYTKLEEEILAGRGMPTIVQAAERLVQVILLHLIHEERFLETLSRSILLRHRDANTKICAQLFDIEAGLEQGKAGTVSQLLLLGKLWMKEHMDLER